MSRCRNSKRGRMLCKTGENPKRNFFSVQTRAEHKFAMAHTSTNSVNSNKPGSWEVHPPTAYIPGNASKFTGLVPVLPPYTRDQRRKLHHGLGLAN